MLSQQRFADLFADMPANVTFHGVDLKKQSLHEIVSGLGSFDCVADMPLVLYPHSDAAEGREGGLDR